MYKSSNFSTPSPTLNIFCLCYDSHHGGCEVASHWSFDLHFLPSYFPITLLFSSLTHWWFSVVLLNLYIFVCVLNFLFFPMDWPFFIMTCPSLSLVTKFFVLMSISLMLVQPVQLYYGGVFFCPAYLFPTYYVPSICIFKLKSASCREHIF